MRNKTEQRVEAWLDLATSDTFPEGLQWYLLAHQFSVQLAHDTHIPLATVVGVIAALSPSVYWELNKRQAEALCRQAAEGLPLEDVPLTTYGGQCRRALAIVRARYEHAEDVITLLNGAGRPRAFKTVAFFWNILTPEARHRVTVDQHIVAALGWEDRFTPGAAGCYTAVADAIIAVAARRGLVPCQVQAIVWCTYKALKELPEAPF
jgi:hypothetical protein